MIDKTITTMEGDEIKVSFIKGSFRVHVPLKEVLASEWCDILKRYIDIHPIEVFRVKYSLGFEDEHIVLESDGYCENTKKLMQKLKGEYEWD